MNQSTSSADLWTPFGDPTPAPVRLRRVVDALTRARRLQLLVDHAFGGVLLGLSLAAIAVLAARLAHWPYPLWQVAAIALIGALTVALVVGWRRRPDALEVAIRADLMLNLKQRLSTAWEFTTVAGSAELAERLAAQAVKAGLPARPRLVFPLTVNRWGRLTPLAAAALLLASLHDFDRMHAAPPREVDAQVVSEGQRLSAFARAMQARARRDALQQSAQQAAQLERLGTRMQSGALSRAQSLGQLRAMGESLAALRSQALTGATEPDTDPGRVHNADGSPKASGLNPGAMLERTSDGALNSGDTRALPGSVDDHLARSGIPPRELEEALRRRQADDDQARRKMLEKSDRSDRAAKELRELAGALEQVRRARERLREFPHGTDAEQAAAADAESLDGGEDRGDGAAAGSPPGREAHGALPSGALGAAGAAGDRPHSLMRSDSTQSGPVLMPRSQSRAGEVFVSPGQVLPRPARPSVENVAMSSEFAPQVEEVLSKEQYPAHYKQFIRTYFLTLSRGEQAAQRQPAVTR